MDSHIHDILKWIYNINDIPSNLFLKNKILFWEVMSELLYDRWNKSHNYFGSFLDLLLITKF